MRLRKRDHVEVTFPKMRPLRAITVAKMFHDLRQSEVQLTVYVHPDDLLIALHTVKDDDDHDS